MGRLQLLNGVWLSHFGVADRPILSPNNHQPTPPLSGAVHQTDGP